MISVLWILAGMKVLELPSEVTSALIVTWTILIQYYFRKKQSERMKGRGYIGISAKKYHPASGWYYNKL